MITAAESLHIVLWRSLNIIIPKSAMKTTLLARTGETLETGASCSAETVQKSATTFTDARSGIIFLCNLISFFIFEIEIVGKSTDTT